MGTDDTPDDRFDAVREFDRLVIGAAAAYFDEYPDSATLVALGDSGKTIDWLTDRARYLIDAVAFLDAEDRPCWGLPPSGWGVYHLIGKNNRLLYVGMTGRPLGRAREHLSEFGVEIIKDIEWYPCRNRRRALELEAERIAELRPPLNIAGLPA